LDTGFWLALAPLALLLALVLRTRPRLRRASLQRYARRVDLPLPSKRRDDTEHLLATRSLATDVGAITGVVAAAVWTATAQPPALEEPSWVLVLLGALFTGGAVGAGVSAALETGRRPTPGEPRVARATAATLDDYVAPLELHGGRIVAVLPTLTLVAAWAAASWSGRSDATAVPTGALGIALLSLGVVAGSELAGRRLIGRPQTATTDLELAWDDALRARALRDLSTAPIAVGTYGTFGVLLALGDALQHGAFRDAAFGGIGLLLVAAVVVAVVSTSSRPHRHFRRRLWPDLAAPASAR
jgi:hypothetical protein